MLSFHKIKNKAMKKILFSTKKLIFCKKLYESEGYKQYTYVFLKRMLFLSI